MYNDPDTRQTLKIELRNHLADEINYATFDFAAPPPEASQKRSQCKCYLHKYFHADVRLTFPDCYLQHHHDGHQSEESSPQQGASNSASTACTPQAL